MSSYSLPEKVFHSFLSLGRRNFSSREGGKKRRGKKIYHSIVFAHRPRNPRSDALPFSPPRQNLVPTLFSSAAKEEKLFPESGEDKKNRPEKKKSPSNSLVRGGKDHCAEQIWNWWTDRGARPLPHSSPPKNIPESYIRILKSIKFEDIFILPPLFFLPGKPTMSKRRGRKDGKRKGEKGVLDRKLRWKKGKKRRRRRLCRRLHHKLSSRISRRRKGQKT